MTQNNPATTQSFRSASAAKKMMIGAIIGLVLISIFLLGITDPNPAWGKLWWIRPLVIVPLAGAGGGLFYYFINHKKYESGWVSLLAKIISVIGFVFAIWIGMVLGLDGTLWN